MSAPKLESSLDFDICCLQMSLINGLRIWFWLVQKIYCSKLTNYILILWFLQYKHLKKPENSHFSPQQQVLQHLKYKKSGNIDFLCLILFVSGLECQKHECTFSFQLKLLLITKTLNPHWWAELDIRFCQIKTFLVKDHVLFWQCDAMGVFKQMFLQTWID